MRLLKSLSIALALLSIAGCSLLPDKIDETKDWSASKFYSEAKTALNDGNYETAIKNFETLEARYPFGPYAQQAELEVAYAYYKYDEADSAIAAADRFIKLHPRHPNVDYAYYLKGLVNFNRSASFVDRILPQDPAQRDPSNARKSFDDFDALVKNFPNSKYTPDARQRMVYLRNNLSRYEVFVADYYMRRGGYVAAINRAKFLIEHYPNTPANADALAIMATAYRALGETKLAEDTERVLKLNFPAHPLGKWTTQAN